MTDTGGDSTMGVEQSERDGVKKFTEGKGVPNPARLIATGKGKPSEGTASGSGKGPGKVPGKARSSERVSREHLQNVKSALPNLSPSGLTVRSAAEALLLPTGLASRIATQEALQARSLGGPPKLRVSSGAKGGPKGKDKGEAAPGKGQRSGKRSLRSAAKSWTRTRSWSSRASKAPSCGPSSRRSRRGR